MTGRDLVTVARASLPFFWVMVGSVVLFAAFPQIVLYLPQTMIGK
jgi:TRAP-type C4-dicarboxylate transport system permease large subunit